MSKGMNRTTALTLSAIMTVNLCTVGLSAPAFAAEAPTAVVQNQNLSDVKTKSKFQLKTGAYSTRLKMDYSDNGILEIAFKEYDYKTGEDMMTNKDAHEFLDHALIQFNDGKVYTFKDAGFKLANYGNGESNSVFQTTNPEIINTLVNDDDFKVAILDPQGNLVYDTEGKLPTQNPNTMDKEQREKFINKYNGVKDVVVDKSKLQEAIQKAEALKEADYTPESYKEVKNKLVLAKLAADDHTAKQEVVNKNADELNAAIDKLQPAEGTQNTEEEKADGLKIVAAGFDAEHSAWAEKWGITFSEPAQNFKSEVVNGDVVSIEVNGVKFEGKDVINASFSTTAVVDNLFEAFSDEAKDAFKITGKDASAQVKITYKDGKVLKFGDPKKDDQKQPETTPKPSEDKKDTPEAKPQTPDTAKDTSDKGEKVSADSFNVIKAELVKAADHSEVSMAGATMLPKAELLRNADGTNTVVLHFKPAVINGILAYATGLHVEGETSNEFILSEDNSATCIIGLPSFEGDQKVFNGHIYSSVMDNEVALKIGNFDKKSDIDKALNDKIIECENNLKTGNFYDKTVKELQEAIDEAKNNPQDKAAAYAKLVSAQTKLREKLDDPFVGDKFFFVDAIDTSVVGSKLLAPQVRVDVDAENNKTITGVYNTALQWWGKSSIVDVKVFADDARTQPIKVETKDLGDGRLQFKFTVKEVPASGVFKTIIEEKDGRKPITSDLQLDYATLRKGPQKQLLQEAIKKANTYVGDDFSTRLPLSDKKDDFTPASWDAFAEVIHDCTEDLKTDMTQEQIDADIARVNEARENLIYKAKAGKGKTVNGKVSAFNNPENYYGNGGEFDSKPNHVGWSGSKILFGNEGKVYRVLNNGKTLENNKISDSGKVLIMAENDRVKTQFAKSNPDSLQDAVRWDKSIAREYLNGEFYENNFTDAQKDAIVETEVTTKYQPNVYETASLPDIQTKDKIFAPSAELIKNPVYGYASNDSRSSEGTFGLRNLNTNFLDDILVMSVKPLGTVESSYTLDSPRFETLPVMNLDADRIIMTVDAKSGLTNEVEPVSNLETNLWKLVLKNDKLALSNPKAERVGDKVKVEAKTNADGLCAVVVDGNDVQTGKILAAGKVADGSFKLPANFNNENHKVFLLGVNETKSGYESSDPVQIPAEQLVALPEAGTDAKDDQKKATNTVVVNMFKDGQKTKSMADDMFAAKADVVPDGDHVILKLYVAYPIPAFADQGKNGTVLNPSIEYKGMSYPGNIDITSKPTMEVKRRNATFGLNKGDKIPAEVISFRLPKSALDEKFLKVHGYVNVVMNDDVVFDMYLSDVDVDLNAKPEKKDPSKKDGQAGSSELDVVDSTTPNTETFEKPKTISPRGSNSPRANAQSSGSAAPKIELLSLAGLPNGEYSVVGDMYKSNKSGESMANKALDHNIKITVEDGVYYATLNFRGIKVGAKMGYLGSIKYLDNSGNMRDAEVLESITVDGVSYPQTVRIQLNNDAINNGWQALQVFVQAMEDISEGSGTQDVYLKLDPNGVTKGYDAGKSFYGTIAQTQSQRLSATGDQSLLGAASAILIAGLAALGFKKYRQK